MWTVLLLSLVWAQARPLTPASPELRVSYPEFKRLYDKGEVLVLDTRSEEAYQSGHIPGAVLVPLDAVEAKIPELRKEKRAIVTYCS